MAARKPRNTSSSSIPPPIDFIDLTTESPIDRSLQTCSSSTARTQHNSYREQDEAILISTVLDTLGATVTIATSRTGCRSRLRNGTRSEPRGTTRSTSRIRTRIRALNRSRSNINNECKNDIQLDKTITLDDTTSPKHSGPWCINDSTMVTPSVLTCAICLDELLSKHKPTTTRCGHIFCAECLNKVIREKKKCPTCQMNITLKSCTRLYF